MRRITLILSIILSSANVNIIAQKDSVWTLQKCIEYAFNQNIQVRKSELSNERFIVYADQAKAQRLPSVNVSVSQNFNWSRSTTPGATGLPGNNGSGYSANSAITIFNYSRITNLIKQAELGIAGGTCSLETTKESISLSILNAYLQILYAEEQVKNGVKQLESTTGQMNLASERLVIKLISQSDYAQVKLQLATEKLTLANAESQLALAKVILMQLMELPVTSGFNIAHPGIEGSLNQNRNPDGKTVYETALTIKPQVKKAAINKEIAAVDKRIEKAAYFPTLSASAGISSSFPSQVSDPYLDRLNNGLKPSAGFSLGLTD